MKIKICQEKEAEQNHFDTDYAVISITRAELDFTKSRVTDVLRLFFDDITPPQDKYDDPLPAHYRPFNWGDALSIARFAEQHQGNLLIHCHAGISRSPAVALALLEHYEGAQAALDFLRPGYYLPNWYVFKVLSEVLKEQLA